MARGVEPGAIISVRQCLHLAQRWYTGRSAIDWRPRSAADAARIFRDVGLTGPFWEV